MHSSRSHGAMIRVYDAAGNVIETHEHKGEFRDYWGFRKGLLRAQGQAELSLAGGNRFVSSFLTASSVIAVMPACILTVPNPGSRNEWPAHSDRGIHYVWP